MGSKYTSATVSISCIVIKKCEDKAYVQKIFGEYTYVKHIPHFNSLQPSHKNQLQNTFTYQKSL